jgi:type I restriction enzyme R subunit
MDDENCEDTSNLDKPSRDFLDAAIKDYNKYF